jgi:hypothetical protein
LGEGRRAEASLERGLFISDLQIPFEAEHALRFCQAVAKEFKIPPDHIYNVGDEVDQYWGGLWDKDPDALHTPNSELYESKQKLLKWYRAFPQMKLAVSNHGMRWAKRASKAGLPSQMIKSYQEILEAPKGWQWKDEWIIKGKRAPVRMVHGVGYGGAQGARNAAMDAGVSTIIGHLHGHAGISTIRTARQNLWSMNVGCLIDVEAYAFEYGRDSRNKPCLGVGVVVDGGLTPIFVPYERGL